MDGYYDHVPLVELRHPLVITSPLRELTRAVTYRVSSLLGLPFHDIDRLIEHRSGRTLEQLLLEEGVVAYRDTEATCLEKVLEQRPSGMIALGDQDRPLPGRHDRAESSRFSVLILDLELAILYWRIQSTARARESTQPRSPAPRDKAHSPPLPCPPARRRLSAAYRKRSDSFSAWPRTWVPEHSRPSRRFGMIRPRESWAGANQACQ